MQNDTLVNEQTAKWQQQITPILSNHGNLLNMAIRQSVEIL